MDGPPLPRGLDEVAVVGAVTSVDEAVQMHQMRFILMWAMRVQSLPGAQLPLGRSASRPPR